MKIGKISLVESKKGQMSMPGWGGALIGGAAALVLSGLFMAYGAKITGDVQTGFTANGLPYNITQDTLQGTKNLSSNQGNIGTVVGFTVILTLLFGAIGYFTATQSS